VRERECHHRCRRE